MSFSFGRSSTHRDLDLLRDQIGRVREQIATLERSQEVSTTQTEADDAYSAVRKFRVALTQRDLEARRQELTSLLERAAALEQAALGRSTGEFAQPIDGRPEDAPVDHGSPPNQQPPDQTLAAAALTEELPSPASPANHSPDDRPPARPAVAADQAVSATVALSGAGATVQEQRNPGYGEAGSAAIGSPQPVPDQSSGLDQRRRLPWVLAAAAVLVAGFAIWAIVGGRLGTGNAGVSQAPAPQPRPTAVATTLASQPNPPSTAAALPPTVISVMETPRTAPPPTPVPPTVEPAPTAPTVLEPTPTEEQVDASLTVPDALDEPDEIGLETEEEEEAPVIVDVPPVVVTAVTPPPPPRPVVRTARIYAPGFGGVYLRSAPSYGGRILRTLTPGTVVELIGGLTYAEGLSWQQVRGPGGSVGWVTAGTLS